MAKSATVAQSSQGTEAQDRPLLDPHDATLEKLVARGKEQGYVTYEQLSAGLPQDQVSSEQIEDVLAQLLEMGINVVEGEEKEDSESAAATAAPEPSEKPEEPAPPAAATTEDIGRTDDPVRMYLREMGSVERLSREGEIAIAKRIEAGREKMIGAICESPLTIRAIIQWRDALQDERILLRDVIDLNATYGAETPTVDNSANGGAGPNGLAANRAAPAANGQDNAATPGNGTAATTNGHDNTAAAAQDKDGTEAADGEDVDEDEDDAANLSRAAMEARLKPDVLKNFDEIGKTYKKLRKLQDQRLAGMKKKSAELSTAQARRYTKLQDELVRL